MCQIVLVVFGLEKMLNWFLEVEQITLSQHNFDWLCETLVVLSFNFLAFLAFGLLELSSATIKRYFNNKVFTHTHTYLLAYTSPNSE